MLKDAHTFSSFSTNDIEKAQTFYGQTLGLDVRLDEAMDILEVRLADGARAMIYPKDDHVAATFTVLNFVVDDVENAVDELVEQGVTFEHYDHPGLTTDDRGISKGPGPRIAWFKDPAGNTLAVLQSDK